MDALTYRKVEKSFGDVRAVKPLDLDIPEGGIFGLLGPNGAGKSTLIRMTMGIYLADAGEVSILGKPRDSAASALLGYLPEDRGLYPKMKVGELLRFFGRLRGLSASEASRRSAEGLKRVGLEKWEQNKVDELSKGMQQKIQLLVAIQHRPKVAILDEPFSGLDPVNVELFMEIVQELVDQGMTVVFSTHQMEQVEQLCQSIALINKGEVVLKGDVAEIRRRYGANAATAEFSDGESLQESDFTDLADQVHLRPNEARLFLKDGVTPSHLLQRLLDRRVGVTRFEAAQASMHDIFVRVVKGDGHAN